MPYCGNKSDAALPGNLLIGSVVTEMPPFCFGLGAQVATTEVHLPRRQCTPPSDSHRKRVSYSSPTESDFHQIEVTSVPIPPSLLHAPNSTSLEAHDLHRFFCGHDRDVTGGKWK